MTVNNQPRNSLPWEGQHSVRHRISRNFVIVFLIVMRWKSQYSEILEGDGRAWWMIRNFMRVDYGRTFWLIDVSVGLKKVVSKDGAIGIGSKSQSSAIRVEGTELRKRMKWDFSELEECEDCSGGMRIRRKRSGGEIFARRGDGSSIKCRSGWREIRRRISQHLSVRYGNRNRVRSIRWW
jgi:hypothetical protein